MTTATERYKMLLANTFERVCILEERLEQAQERNDVAEPKLQIDRRLDRIEEAILKLAKSESGTKTAAEVEKILRGENSEETDDQGITPIETE